MSSTCPVIKIMPSNPETQGPFVEINECDFNDKIHVLFEGQAPAPVDPVEIKFANKAAKTLAADLGLSDEKLATITGTGTGGKLTVEDLENSIK